MRPNFKTPIGIFGQGLTGRSVFRLLSLWSVPQDQLFLFDEKSLEPQQALGDFIEQRGLQTLVVSPGVPLEKPEIKEFARRGGQITSELEIAWAGLDRETVLCVTGSVGKSTVSALLHAGLKELDPAAFIGGNFGFPLADYVADVMEGKRPRARYLVLELSSYQLENFPSLKSDGTILTSLLANHLERYPSKGAYYRTKWTLALKTRGPLVLNKSGFDLETFAAAELAQKTHPGSALIWTDRNDPAVPAQLLKESSLIGNHNKDNLALAARLLMAIGVPNPLPGMLSFRGLPHRVEALGVKGGIRWINDSKATTIDSVHQAVKTVLPDLKEGQKLVLLVGGKDKNLPWEELSSLRGLRVQTVFFGEYGEAAKEKSGLNGAVFPRLGIAIQEALKLCHEGDTLLLSPGGSSLDEFKSFEDRGAFFRSQFESWQPSPG